MAKYKSPFKIGDWVKIERIAVSSYNDRYSRTVKTVSLRPEEKEIVGQICGAVYRYDGKRDPGYAGSGIFFGDYGEPPSWTAKKAHLLWQVKTSIIGKPIEAFKEDIQKIPFQDYIYPPLPFRPPQPEWSEKEKEYMCQQVKDWPRDEKGRWIKKGRKSNG